jgi:hypothetical protein
VTGQRFSPGAQVSFANKTDHHNVSEIFLKVAMKNKKKKLNYLILVMFSIGINVLLPL